MRRARPTRSLQLVGIVAVTLGFVRCSAFGTEAATPSDAADGGVLPAKTSEASVPDGPGSGDDDGDVKPETGAPLAYRDVVLSDNPIAYYRLDEPTESTAHSQINNNDGIYEGTVKRSVAGAIVHDENLAVSFGDTTGNGHVKLDSSFGKFEGKAPYAFEAWIRLDGPTNDYPTVWSKLDAEDLPTMSGQTCYIVKASSNLRCVRAASQVMQEALEVPFAPGVFTHFVVSSDGAVWRVFLNGQLKGSKSISIAVPSTLARFMIGSNAVGGETFLGAMDEVAVYDHDLAEARVLAHYKAGADQP